MDQKQKTRRATRERASEMSLGGDIAEDTASTLNLQAGWIAARYALGDAHARLIAELAFAKGASR